MKVNKFSPKKLTAVNFMRYGWIIEYAGRKKVPKDRNLFKIIVRQPGLGWRIAYLVVRESFITKLEQHPGSFESFEPVSGRGLIYVSTKKDLNSVECFYLDRPVILKKGIWHGVVRSGGDFDIKIAENLKVKCVYWPLGAILR